MYINTHISKGFTFSVSKSSTTYKLFRKSHCLGGKDRRVKSSRPDSAKY